MKAEDKRGVVYHCPVCGAEIAVLAAEYGSFLPRCCNVAMKEKKELLEFFFCPICHSEIALLKRGSQNLSAHCCNREMVPSQ